MADEPFHIERAREPRIGFGDHEYDIFQGPRVVARYGHDYRGGEHWIRFGEGRKEACALGAVWQFTEDGGAEPLRLGEPAIAWLRRRISPDAR